MQPKSPEVCQKAGAAGVVCKTVTSSPAQRAWIHCVCPVVVTALLVVHKAIWLVWLPHLVEITPHKELELQRQSSKCNSGSGLDNVFCFVAFCRHFKVLPGFGFHSRSPEPVCLKSVLRLQSFRDLAFGNRGPASSDPLRKSPRLRQVLVPSCWLQAVVRLPLAYFPKGPENYRGHKEQP